MINKMINKKSILHFLTLLVFLSSCCGLKKVSPFEYKKHPVHPLIIKKILPDIATNKINDCTKLRSQGPFDKIEVIEENSVANKGIWYRSTFSEHGYIDYHVVTIYHNYNCLIIREFDGTLTRAFVCFLSLNCRKICINGYLQVNNLRDDFVKISGDDLFIGDIKHNISQIINTK